MLLVANIVTTSKALVTRSEALVTTSNIWNYFDVTVSYCGCWWSHSPDSVAIDASLRGTLSELTVLAQPMSMSPKYMIRRDIRV